MEMGALYDNNVHQGTSNFVDNGYEQWAKWQRRSTLKPKRADLLSEMIDPEVVAHMEVQEGTKAAATRDEILNELIQLYTKSRTNQAKAVPKNEAPSPSPVKQQNSAVIRFNASFQQCDERNSLGDSARFSSVGLHSQDCGPPILPSASTFLKISSDVVRQQERILQQIYAKRQNDQESVSNKSTTTAAVTATLPTTDARTPSDHFLSPIRASNLFGPSKVSSFSQYQEPSPAVKVPPRQNSQETLLDDENDRDETPQAASININIDDALDRGETVFFIPCINSTCPRELVVTKDHPDFVSCPDCGSNVPCKKRHSRLL